MAFWWQAKKLLVPESPLTEEIRRSHPDDFRIIISCEHTPQGTLRGAWK